jgi:hypothetical protein
LDPLKIIEKAVNFLRRRFDRFKHKYDFDELSEMIKILKIDKYDFGFENNGNKFVIWKKRKGSGWEAFAELYKNCNIVKTRLKVKWKERRRKVNLIISLMEAFIKEFGWKAKEGYVWNLINQGSVNEFYLWKRHQELFCSTELVSSRLSKGRTRVGWYRRLDEKIESIEYY